MITLPESKFKDEEPSSTKKDVEIQVKLPPSFKKREKAMLITSKVGSKFFDINEHRKIQFDQTFSKKFLPGNTQNLSFLRKKKKVTPTYQYST